MESRPSHACFNMVLSNHAYGNCFFDLVLILRADLFRESLIEKILVLTFFFFHKCTQYIGLGIQIQ